MIGEFAAACRRVVVVDNGCRDRTVARAEAAGAVVVAERERGYGAACLTGIAALAARGAPDVVLFLDGDGADDPADLPALLAPLAAGRADLVLGSRTMTGARAEPGALLPQQRFGNWLATRLLAGLHGAHHTDLGPYRAIRWAALERLAMRDRGFGWTIEMQIKAAQRGLRVVEVPCAWRRRRGGASKISGTIRGTVGAGWTILSTVVRYSLVT